MVGGDEGPLATPVQVCSGCVWQSDGQWWRISFQLKRRAGSVPSCGSVPPPVKSIVSPTFQVRLGAGEVDRRHRRGVAGGDRAPCR